MSRRDRGKPEDTRNEDGVFSIGRWFTGRAGSGPGSKLEDKPSWWSQSDSRRGPTRGMSASTGHDRKGGWLFRGRGR